MSDVKEQKSRWRRPTTYLNILLILALILLIIAIIISMLYVPDVEQYYFDFPDQNGRITRVKITRQDPSHDISSAAISSAATSVATAEIDDTVKILYTKYGAVSIRRDNHVVSRGYIDPLEPM
jgi:ABC-type Na+ efflux pump permease subunit